MIKGIDISNHNENIDFNRVKADGVEFIYIKATEGTTYQDPLLNQHYSGALNKGFKLGFYHYLVASSEPETQAENFYNQIKDKQNDLKPCLDIETNGYNVMDYALRFIARFNKLSNMELCIYASPYFINDNLDSRLGGYSLWVAHYGVNQPMANLIWGDGYSGHQYTDTGRVDGINGNVDMNNFTDDILLGGQPIIVPQSVSRPVNNGNDWVRRLQSECNVQGFSGQTIDGYPGVNTLDGCPLIREGANGNITRLLQEKLNSLGYDTNGIDGIFGNGTYHAVVNFQNANGLGQDGIVGRNTWSKLLGL